MTWRRSCFLLALALLAGCGQLPDPNDLAALSPEDRPRATLRILASAKDYFGERVAAKEITDDQRNALLRAQSERLLTRIDPQRVLPEDLWIYGDLLRTTGRTADAAEVLKRAAKAAPDWDRRVNDTLRYAACLAALGKVSGAIAAAKEVMVAPDSQCAPILPAVLYEIVPAGQGKGKDSELADLLILAEKCHERTTVDGKSDAGKMFLLAKSHHLRKAEEKVAQLRAGGIVRV